MRWSEINLEGRTWTIPGARMKNARPHDVHLSDAASAVLRNIPRIEGCEFVLSTTGKAPVSGLSKAKAAIVKARGKGKPEPLAESHARSAALGCLDAGPAWHRLDHCR
jgi:integrase